MPLLWLSLGFVAGLFIAIQLPSPIIIFVVLLAALAILFLEIRCPPKWPWYRQARAYLRLAPGAVLVAIMLGAAWVGWLNRPAGQADLRAYHGKQNATIAGTVVNMPERSGNRLPLIIKVDRLTLAGHGEIAAYGKAQAVLYGARTAAYGERLVLRGDLTQPAQDGYGNYLAARGIRTTIDKAELISQQPGHGNPVVAAIYALRQQAAELIAHLYPQPEADLVKGILLGLDAGLPETIKEDFRASGLTHLIAISGFNIAIVAGMLGKLSGRLLDRWKALLAVIVALSVYTLLAGAEASVVRAAIMGSLGLLGTTLGRRQTGVNTLAFTAAVMALYQPYILFDLGFQLSFLATLGLVLYATPWQQGLEEWLAKRWPVEKVRPIAALIGEYFLFTLAAQLMTLPVILYHFHRLPLSTFLANPLTLPAQPLLMILSGLSVLTGLLLPWLGQVFAWLAWPLAAYTIKMAALFGTHMSGGSVTLTTFPISLLIGIYLAIGLVTFFWPKRDQLKVQVKPALFLMLLGLTAVMVWRPVINRPDGRLHLMFTGTSGQVEITTPSGQRVLVWDKSEKPGQKAALPSDLDAILSVTLACELDRLKAVKTRLFLPVGCRESAGSSNVAGFYEVGDEIDLGDGVRLHVLLVTRAAIAFQLHYGEFDLLSPGLFSPDTLQQRVGTVSDSTIIWLNEKYHQTPEQWQQTLPQLIVTGESKGTGSNILSTGIKIITDGTNFWVQNIR